MPILTRTKIVDEPFGMECDCCGRVDRNGFNDFSINYRFGYGTQLDESTVTAAICDRCLAILLAKHVPNAVFRDSQNQTISHEQIVQMLDTPPSLNPDPQ